MSLCTWNLGIFGVITFAMLFCVFPALLANSLFFYIKTHLRLNTSLHVSFFMLPLLIALCQFVKIVYNTITLFHVVLCKVF
jgi:hypothetical protein